MHQEVATLLQAPSTLKHGPEAARAGCSGGSGNPCKAQPLGAVLRVGTDWHGRRTAFRRCYYLEARAMLPDQRQFGRHFAATSDDKGNWHQMFGFHAACCKVGTASLPPV